jgi:hypothetical protein
MQTKEAMTNNLLKLAAQFITYHGTEIKFKKSVAV